MNAVASPAVAQAAETVIIDQPVAIQQPRAIAAQAPTPAELLRHAMNTNADPALLEKFMALQERWEANEARKAFVAAMAEFKAEPLEIFKRKEVGYETKDGDFVGYKHAQLSDVAEVVVPALARHGLSHRWDIKQESGRVIVTCTVTHRQGHSESVTIDAAPDNSGKKNAIQQVASAVTYCQRYTLLAITGLATKDLPDDDGQGAGDSGTDIGALLADLQETQTDAAAFAHWTANRDSLKEDRQAYERFKAAVVNHRKALAARSKQ